MTNFGNFREHLKWLLGIDIILGEEKEGSDEAIQVTNAHYFE